MRDNLSIIILSAGLGKRMKSYGPKALIRLSDTETVISRQISILGAIYPGSEILVVVGFGAEKISRDFKDRYNIKLIYNPNYENVNVAHSISVGIKNASHKNVLIVYGDLVFNTDTLKGFYPDKSTIIYDSQKKMGPEEVGLTVIDNTVSTFSYGLPTKWAQIIYLAEPETRLTEKIIYKPEKHKMFGFEILNSIIDMGAEFQAVQPAEMDIVEIDASKDIAKAKKVKI